MRTALIIIVVIPLAFLLTSCGSTQPAPVQVIGAPQDLGSLTGEWIGTYDSNVTGRNGSITFHLTENPQGAHGDILMVPAHAFVYDQERNHQGMTSSSTGSGASVLSIEFVRVTGGTIEGRIAPYPDPDVPDATLETHFTGRADGEWIEGTFVTYSDRGISPRRGKWRVHRKSATDGGHQ